MAFPTTGIVDDCARSNENPLVGVAGYWGTVSNAQLSGNIIRSVAAAQFYAISSPTYTADAEAYAAVFTLPNLLGTLSLYLRFNLGASNYYICQWAGYDGSNFTGKFFKALAGVETEIFSTAPSTEALSAGDQIGFSVAGTTLSAFRNGTLKFSTTDSAVSAGGSLAILGSDNAAAYSSVGGGSIAAAGGTTSTGRGGLLMGIGR